MTDASDPIREQSPAVSAPYISPAKFSVKGYKTMDAGTLEMIWLKPMAHQYSFPATAFLSTVLTMGLEETDDENMKKHKKR